MAVSYTSGQAPEIRRIIGSTEGGKGLGFWRGKGFEIFVGTTLVGALLFLYYHNSTRRTDST